MNEPRTDTLRPMERQLLEALYAARGLKYMTAPDLLSAHPVTFEGRSRQGIHQTAASLVRKGFIVKELDDDGHVAYHIRQAGVEELRKVWDRPVRQARIQRSSIGGPTAEVVAAYLPSNYEVAKVTSDYILISGHDNAGWTLDGYVIPRLASGLIWAKEIV